ncbi:MAG TPA: type II secretion system F family protein [Clostridiales bacterium]|nr:type II secretion system F family protein [Clostridiales bacterium]
MDVMTMIKEIIIFSEKHKLFTILMLIVNSVLGILITWKIALITNKSIYEAMGRRMIDKSLYKKCAYIITRYVEDYERRSEKSGLFIKAKNRAKKLGFKGEHSTSKYLFVRYGISIIIFIVSFIINFPSAKESIKASIIVFITSELIIRRKRGELNNSLQKYVYKIYKYLHNQIASGIKVTDAIKNLYEVIDDKDLKEVLIRMAARYELTTDIDAALNEFISVYDSQEAESFCIAIKQGILTGDNSELLARQEDIMFKKYFNYIQSETDSCRTRSFIAAIVFTAIIVVMILVPIFFEASGALTKIFIS